MLKAIVQNSDTAFLTNRASQMLNCMKDGKVPFFYYDDYYGLGYGSSFFYGQLIIYPFLPILAVGGKTAFVVAWFLVALFLYFTGARALAKTLTSNYVFVAFVFLCSSFTTLMIFEVAMLCNLMGTALALWCLAVSVQFFRDHKSCIPASLLFFVVLNTHLISAVLCFLGIVLVCIYYWDKTRFHEYLKFAAMTCTTCAYFIANFLWHAESIGNTAAINKMTQESSQVANVYTMAIFPFETLGQLFSLKFFTGVTLCDAITAIVLTVLTIYGWKTFSRKKKVVLVGCILAIILGSGAVWKAFNLNVWLVPIQFSFRYITFVWLVLLCIILDKAQSHDLKLWMSLWLLIYMTITCTLFQEPGENYAGAEVYIGNGEYLPVDYNKDMIRRSVTGPDGKILQCTQDKGVLSFNADKSGEYQIPKVWYKGYAAESMKNSANIKCYEKDGLVTMRVNSSFEIRVEYRHPLALVLLDLVCLLIAFTLLVGEIRRKFYATKTRS